MKALFLDYYGTVVHELGPVAQGIIVRVYKTTSGVKPEEILAYWYQTINERLAQANGESFRTEHVLALENFRALVRHFNCPEDPEALLDQMELHWRTTEPYEDVREFMNAIDVPVYIVTNSDDDYLLANLKRHDIHPADIFNSERARYYKPNPEVFRYALSRTGLDASEVIHVGDSVRNDILCPRSVGIRSILINRENKQVPEGVESVGSLSELKDLIG